MIDVFVAVGELFDGVGGADEVAVDVVAVVGEGFFQRFVLLAQGVAFFLQVFGVVLVGVFDNPDEDGADKEADGSGDDDAGAHGVSCRFMGIREF